MAIIAAEKVALFEESVNEFRNAFPLFKREKRDRLLSQVDRMARSRAGVDFLEKHIEQLVNAGIFAGTVWENPQNLQSGLVQGTLLAGHPSSTSEILSELRMTGILQERLFYTGFGASEARKFIQEVLVQNAANFLGFHAISLLRVDKDSEGEWRIYFFNPNSVGRQDWGQGIRPEVTGKGEKPGESSLPFAEMTSRLYAYHYNSLRVKELPRNVPNETVKRIAKLARESWGRKYRWTNF